MEKAFTKGEIDRLGDKIREQSVSIDDETITELQSYRTSYKEALAQTFNILCASSKKIHPTCIVAFRIKRFQSIISKLERYSEMRFSRMWDIAGCRCILRNDKEVYRLKSIIENDKLLEIVKEYDYIAKPQNDGYKSLHLFVKHGCSDKIIEVQLRSLVNHNWATLVEISDLLFDSKLKEYGEHKELLRFHLLLSNTETLSIKDKYEISKIIKTYNYFEKLSEVFARNYIKVRKQWFELESQNSHKYFLIETTKDDVPKIDSFSNFQDAENTYLNIYKTRQNANIVLTHLQMPNYKQISIAYSNYILTFHNFLSECLDILESLIVESLEKRAYYTFYKNYSLYNSLVFNHIKNIITEINEIHPLSLSKKSKKGSGKMKQKEWFEDIRKQLIENQQRTKKMLLLFRRNMPKNIIGRFIVKKISKNIGVRYKKKMDTLLKESSLT